MKKIISPEMKYYKAVCREWDRRQAAWEEIEARERVAFERLSHDEKKLVERFEA